MVRNNSRQVRPRSRSLVYRLLFVAASLTASAALAANAQRSPSAPTTDRLIQVRDIVWHEVESRDGTRLGAISDLLVDMPSGRVLFAAIEPADLFHWPKAVPASAIDVAAQGTIRLKLSLDDWVHAPVLSPDGRRIEQNGRSGVELRGAYETDWSAAAAKTLRGLEVVAPSPGRPPVARFVSLLSLMGTPVLDVNRRPLGAIGGFLINWNARRAMYALVANDSGSLASWVRSGYAIPTVMLTPPGAGTTIVVNAGPAALQRAPLLSAQNANWRRNPDRVYRFEAQASLASTTR